MTFLELHKQIEQTRKARKGIQGRTDYFADDPQVEEFYTAVYKRALHVANEVIKHYEELRLFDPKDKPKITWRD